MLKKGYRKVLFGLIASVGLLVYPAQSNLADEVVLDSSLSETSETIIEEIVESTESINQEEMSSTIESSTNVTTETLEEDSETVEDNSVIKEFDKYVSLKQEKVTIYKDKEFEEIIEHTFSMGQTFLAKEKLITQEEKVYYSLFDAKNEFIGFVFEEEVTVANNQGGVYQAFGEYATVTQNQGVLLSDFEGKERGQVNSIYKNTYLAKGKYHHFNGIVYYSLFDNKNVWQGYIEEDKVSLSGQNKQGTYQNFNKYVVLNKNGYPMWRDFGWTKKHDSNQFLNRTFLAKGEYHHFNGTIYYSLYDSNNVWYGYVNQTGTKLTNHPQGEYVSYRKYVSVKQSSGSSWSNFSWKKRQNLNELAGQTLLAKGIYYHVNGDDYLSLYDQHNKWYGYVNKKFVKEASGRQGAYQQFGKYVTVTNGNYDMWQNFSWKRKSTTKNMKNNTYQAKGLYNHFNGSVYYSIYDNKGKWLGYLNKDATKVGDGAQGIYQSYGKKVTISKKNYPMWQSFSWNEKGNTNSYMNREFNARGLYHHFNGSTYVSLYDKNGKWYGYLNETATSQDAEKMAKVQQLLNRKYRSPNYGIYVMSLTDGSTASVNGTKQFTAASTGKLPAMYYTQKMINEKKIDPNKKYLYTDAINQMPIYSYMRGGAGILQGKPFGTYYSLDTMLNWTAKYSDNQGANFLGYYGANKYEPKMRNEISRIIGRQWVSPFQVSAKENALLIAEMDRQGGQVMKYMQNTIFDNQRIPKYLPVKVAHKIGDVGSFTHDIAVVYTDRPYVLSVMTQYGSYETISILSKEVYDIMK